MARAYYLGISHRPFIGGISRGLKVNAYSNGLYLSQICQSQVVIHTVHHIGQIVFTLAFLHHKFRFKQYIDHCSVVRLVDISVLRSYYPNGGQSSGILVSDPLCGQS